MDDFVLIFQHILTRKKKKRNEKREEREISSKNDLNPTSYPRLSSLC